MSYLIGQLFICLLLAGLAGFLIGWMLRKHFLSQITSELEDAWSAKYQKATREIETIRLELKDAKIKADAAAGARSTAEARLGTIDSSLAEATAKLKDAESELHSKNNALGMAERLVADLRAKIADAESRSRASAAGTAAMAAAVGAGAAALAGPPSAASVPHEVETLRRELANAKSLAAKANQEREAMTQRLAQAEFAVRSNSAAAEKMRADAMAEVSSVRGLVAQVEPLKSQLTSRETALKNAEQKLAALSAERDLALAKLKAVPVAPAAAVDADKLAALEEQVREVTAAKERETAMLAARITERDARLADAEARLSASSNVSGEEIVRLNALVTGLEPLRSAVNERDERLANWDLRFDQAMKDKDAEIARLRSIAASANQKSAELEERVAAAGRHEAEIARLKVVVSELEPLRTQIVEKDKKLADVELRFAAASGSFDDEVARLSEAAKAVEPVKLQLADRETRLSSWDARFNSVVNEKDAEIVRLRQRVTLLDSAGRQLAERDQRVAELTAAVAEIEPLKAAIASRDQQIAAIETRFRVTLEEKETVLKAKDAEIGKLKFTIAETDGLRRQLSEIPVLRAELQSREQAVAQWDTRFATAMREKDEEITTLRGRAASVPSLADRLEASTRQYSTMVEEKDDEIGRLRASLEDSKSHIKALESRHAPLAMAAAVGGRPLPVYPRQILGSVPENPDDLRDIWGVGPVLAKKLNSMGVYYFRQIANWTREDIEFFKTQMDQFQDRIEREDWVTGAKEEHLKKYGEQL